MGTSDYTVARLATELRQAREHAHDETDMLSRLVSIVRQAVAAKADWLRPEMCRPDPVQGFGVYLLHEEADHELAVLVASWLPGRGTPPHDHGTWAVVAAMDGAESNTMWERQDDGTRPGFADLKRCSDTLLASGDVIAMREGTIHSVWNHSDRLTVSLHIYGRHINHTNRSQFDPEMRTSAPYKLTTMGEGVRS